MIDLMLPLHNTIPIDLYSLPEEAKEDPNKIFAYAFIIKNNIIVHKSTYFKWSYYSIFQKAEDLYKEEMKENWMIHFSAIVYEKTFQRQYEGWRLFHKWPGNVIDKEIDKINKKKNKSLTAELHFSLYEEK